jgi:hypothetical protein
MAAMGRSSMSKFWGRAVELKTLLRALGCSAVYIMICGQASKPTAVFQKEHIKVFVRAKSIRVEGLYTFANPGSTLCKQALFYPFPVDSLHPREDYVLVRSEGRVIPTKNAENGVVFGVIVPASGTLPVEVIYEQACLDGSGCYILKSTAAWERPLEHASFEIHVPDELELDWMAYEAGTMSNGKHERIYGFARDDFMPDKDLCMRWHVRARP